MLTAKDVVILLVADVSNFASDEAPGTSRSF
jgi:hypothetical protein